ncbi:Hypothetical predicted protein, partial [Mytilus galloprovincialis]
RNGTSFNYFADFFLGDEILNVKLTLMIQVSKTSKLPFRFHQEHQLLEVWGTQVSA